MQKLFESGWAFFIVALLSVLAGLLMTINGNKAGLVFVLAASMWIVVGIGVRKKSTSGKDE